MAFVKSNLKKARDAINLKDYNAACDAAYLVLEYEPENYNATVFLALSLLELGQGEKSEKTYLHATSLHPDNPLAWQGLSKYYERKEAWKDNADSLGHLVDLYGRANEVVKCAESWQKLVELRRERGTRPEIIEALSLLLPNSTIYAILSNLPPPDLTNPTSTTTLAAQIAIHHSLSHLEEIVALVEIDEEESLKKEVEKRRFRLGASGPEVLKKEVGREIWGKSKLPGLYAEILNHPATSDELRRLTDTKLLRYKERHIHAIPITSDCLPTKLQLLAEIDELVRGAIILGIPDELAWIIYLESMDCEGVAGYDHKTVYDFIKLFPSSHTSSLLQGYFTYTGDRILLEDSDLDSPAIVDEDPFDTIVNAYAENPNSMLGDRILSEVYLAELEYESAVKAAQSGLELLERLEGNYGRRLPRVRIGFKIVLATSFVHIFPPKHHARALSLIDDVLAQSPENTACLMGRGYVMAASKRWDEAASLFSRAKELLPESSPETLRAREEHAWCRCQLHDLEAGIPALHVVADILKGIDERSEDLARCLWRLGKAYWDLGGKLLSLGNDGQANCESVKDKIEDAYRYFISSLKARPSYAPAFTSLGIYYAEFSSPLDPTRASKCFQKAFELDPREAEAARRLAEGFAEDRDWDLVEVVARRTIEGEGGIDARVVGTGGSTTSRYLPINSWAWKAIGIVELHHRNYASAIQALQTALRAEPNDSLSWIRLGEAYNKAGRYIAALKVLERAHELDAQDWVCHYLIGDVKHQMGNFKDAIDAFESIEADRPSEIGVLVSLSQTYFDQGLAEISEVFQFRAEQSLLKCMTTSLKIIEAVPGFRNIAWKTLGDALYFLSSRSSFNNESLLREILGNIIVSLPTGSDRLSSLVPPPALPKYSPLTGLMVLEIALSAYSYRITLSVSESAAKKGSAWFDLGIALHTWAVQVSKSTIAQAKVIEYLTQALREDSGKSIYWVELGNAYFLSDAKKAQHAYILALEIDPKNITSWANLGLLYLHHGDLELANESLLRAQTLNPDYVVAWIGQAMVASSMGHEAEATTIYEHAVSLIPGVLEGDVEFATRSFRKYQSLKGGGIQVMLLPAFFILDRYCQQRPDDATSLHIYALVCEILGHLDTAAELLSRTVAILEAAYEVSEDSVTERRFIITHSNLARVRLALRDFDGATQSFGSALGLLPEDDEPETRMLRAQALFGSGLASFMQGDPEGALASLEDALASAGDFTALKGQITVLLSQTMWALQTDEFKESSKNLLLESISTDPENLTAINTLAGMGILTNDESLVDAALSEILALPREQRHELDPERNVDYLLTQYHLSQEDKKKALSVAQSAVFAEPSRSSSRMSLAKLMIQQGHRDSAIALLSGLTETGIDDLPMALCLQAVAYSRMDSAKALRCAQRAIMLSPSDISCWETLTVVRSQASG